MPERITTIERAYQLAAEGRCRTKGDILQALKHEGHAGAEERLYGAQLARDRKALCRNHREPASD